MSQMSVRDCITTRGKTSEGDVIMGACVLTTHCGKSIYLWESGGVWPHNENISSRSKDASGGSGPPDEHLHIVVEQLLSTKHDKFDQLVPCTFLQSLYVPFNSQSIYTCT